MQTFINNKGTLNNVKKASTKAYIKKIDIALNDCIQICNNAMNRLRNASIDKMI